MSAAKEVPYTVDTQHPAARGRKLTLDQAVRVVGTLHLDPRCVRSVKDGEGAADDAVQAAH